MRQPHLSWLITAILPLTSCAHAPTDPSARAEYDKVNDPAEPTNRTIFAGNQFVDRSLLKPVASSYEKYIPAHARDGIQNFASNLGEPKVLVNDVMQGNFHRAWNTTQRFVVNSTAGGAGFFDAASRLGLPHHDADFGETFGIWGIGAGPAVVLPLFGNSNLRDSVGTVVSFVADPLSRIPGNTISTITDIGGGAGLIDARARLIPTTDSLEKNSLDYYATLRSISAQRRAALIEDGRAGRVTPTAGVVPPSTLPTPAEELQ